MKRVLIVGMLDSVHLARWLKQFQGEGVQFTLFPSTRFRKLHPELKVLLETNVVSLGFTSIYCPKFAVGYIDYLRFEIIKKFRILGLSRLLNSSQFDFVHLLEIQHAGYLYLEAYNNSESSYELITTNYGSDISFFGTNDEHRKKIEKLLALTDLYSAECRRDYILAMEFGFTGKNLPLMPNSGGFADDAFREDLLPLTQRDVVYIKGYGERFGLGADSLQIASILLDKYPDINVVIGSLTPDLEKLASVLERKYIDRLRVLRISRGVSHRELLEILRRSILVIGVSRSDGISTTFLEALVSGAIPVQTNTSCAGEWVTKGFFGLIVEPTQGEVLAAANSVLSAPELYELNAKNNVILAKTYLSYEKNRSIAVKFYHDEWL